MSDPNPEELASLLVDLSARELAVRDDRYLRVQSNNSATIRRKVDSFLLYRPYVLPGRVLDWGCRHAADSTLLRRVFGDAVDLYGCDLEPHSYPAFAAYADLSFSRLGHPYELPYTDAHFDDVIASGVLEHVPQPDHSLRELHRVLRPGGRLLITFLPNLFSYTELIATLMRRVHHERRYTRRRIRTQLESAGFAPLMLGFHQVLPALTWAGSSGSRAADLLRPWVERAFRLNSVLEGRFPFDRVAANIWVVAERR